MLSNFYIINYSSIYVSQLSYQSNHKYSSLFPLHLFILLCLFSDPHSIYTTMSLLSSSLYSYYYVSSLILTLFILLCLFSHPHSIYTTMSLLSSSLHLYYYVSSLILTPFILPYLLLPSLFLYFYFFYHAT